MSSINKIILNGTEYNVGGSGSGLTEDMKEALLQLVSKVAYTDENGQDYYDDLESALYPPANLVSISAVYTQSVTVYDTSSLNDLKADLVVTAHFDDSTTSAVSKYMLSGSLVAGISTITVNYGGESATFNVTVIHDDTAEWDYIWKYTDGLPPVSDWTFTTGGGGYVREMHDDGLFMKSNSGAHQDYRAPYLLNEIIQNGGGISEVEFYISSDYAGTGLGGVRFFESILAVDNEYGLRVLFTYRGNIGGNKLNVQLMNQTSGTVFDGTIIGSFEYDTVYKLRLETNAMTMKGAVYLDGTLLQDNIDLTTVQYGNAVGFTVQTSGNATVKSFKIKHSPADE